MEEHLEVLPWVKLRTLVEKGEKQDVEQYLEALSSADAVLAASRLAEEFQQRLLMLLAPQEAAELLHRLPDQQAARLIQEIPPELAARIVDFVPADEQADILAGVHAAEAEAILHAMSQSGADQARQLLQYPERSAGGIMITQFLSYVETATVESVLHDLRTYSDMYSGYEIQYAYITNVSGQLQGVLRMRDLLLAPRGQILRLMMVPDPLHVHVHASLDELQRLFRNHTYLGVPVVDANHRLVGVVQREGVLRAASNESRDYFLKISGIVGGEELRSMPFLHRCLRRLSWLGPNIVLNMAAASVIALYQETLQAVIALAVFLPIISDMSGCSGNQAVAVSIRELTLGLIRPKEYSRIVLKEVMLGLVNGLVLGLLLGLAAFAWKSDPYLGLVVGVALALNTMLSVLVGGCVPLLLRRINADPALASGPVLTTVTDLCGFIFVLSFARLALPLLHVGI